MHQTFVAAEGKITSQKQHMALLVVVRNTSIVFLALNLGYERIGYAEKTLQCAAL